MRLQKSIKNLIYSFGYYLINVLCTFILRKIMLATIGLAGVSLNSLFHEIIVMMSLSEMGVGTAIVYNLYKPLNEKNEQKIKELMSFFKFIYFLIAGVMIAIGVVLLPFIQNIVNSTGYEISYMRYIFFLFVIQTSVSYCFAYKRSLAAADQKNYVSATIDSVFKLATILVSCVVLWITKRFDIYLIATIILSFANNLAISIRVDKIYPFLKNNKEKLPPDEIKGVFSNVKNLFISKVSGTVTNSTDNILISVLVNTLEVGRYANYALIINAFKQILVQMTNAIQGSVGNLYAEGNFKHMDEVLRRLTYIYFVGSTIFSCGYLCCATAFIDIVFGKEYELPVAVVVVTAVNLYFHAVREPIWQMFSVSGLFKQDKTIGIIGTVVNLIVSILIGIYYGMVGIFLGTLCTYLVQIILKIPILYKKGLYMEWKGFFIYWLKLFLIFILCTGICGFVCSQVSIGNPLISFVAQGALAVMISGLIILAFTYKSEELVYYKGLLLKLRKKG